MHKLTDKQIFADFAQRWEKQFDNWYFFAKAVVGKLRFKAWVKARKKDLSSRCDEVPQASCKPSDRAAASL